MSVSLQKGQKIDLTKGKSSLNQIVVGLGWDPVKVIQKSLFGSSTPNVDCDASAILLSENNKLANNKDVVYFGNKTHYSESVKSTGDNLTGAGDGDDEQLIVTLDKVPQNIQKIVFVVNIYDCVERKQDFGMVQNAYIRILDGSNNQEILKYNLSESYAGKTTLVAGEVYRHNSEWKFAAIGEGTNSSSISEVVKNYN